MPAKVFAMQQLPYHIRNGQSEKILSPKIGKVSINAGQHGHNSDDKYTNVTLLDGQFCLETK